VSSKTDVLEKLVWDTTRSLAAELDIGLRIRRVSRGLAELFGFPEEGLRGRYLLEFMPSLTKEEAGKILHLRSFDRAVVPLRSAGDAQRLMCVLERTDDGAVFFAEPLSGSESVEKAPSEFDAETLTKEVEYFRSHIQYLEALVDRMRKESLLTSSTGLYKRKMLDQLVEAEMARSVRNNRPFALVLCGVDRAQALDQVAGEDARVKTLAVIAKAISSRKRVFDVMGHFTPSELYIVQPENDAKGAMEFSERIRKSLENRRITFPNFEFTISLSFGCAFFHPTRNHYKSLNELISQAEAALYSASTTGGNRVMQAAPASALAKELEKRT
jgi:diguanylate cyclase (GGDEF)-like protein